jgi:7-keto-8-aminopelargonate synthetase-like enzyme
LELVETQPELRRRLAANVALLRGALAALGLDVRQTPSPIIGLRLGGGGDTMARVQRQMATRGILIAHTRDYCGAGPDGMLRIAVFATHSPQMIAQLVDSLRQALEEQRES